MNYKQFTYVQLLNVVDGRLFTKIDDIYDLLNHLTGQSLFTHHLPVAYNWLKIKNPDWFADLKHHYKSEIARFGLDTGKFPEMLHYAELNNFNRDVPAFTPEQMEGFEQYMIENSLLLR